MKIKDKKFQRIKADKLRGKLKTIFKNRQKGRNELQYHGKFNSSQGSVGGVCPLVYEPHKRCSNIKMHFNSNFNRYQQKHMNKIDWRIFNDENNGGITEKGKQKIKNNNSPSIINAHKQNQKSKKRSTSKDAGVGIADKSGTKLNNIYKQKCSLNRKTRPNAKIKGSALQPKEVLIQKDKYPISLPSENGRDRYAHCSHSMKFEAQNLSMNTANDHQVHKTNAQKRPNPEDYLSEAKNKKVKTLFSCDYNSDLYYADEDGGNFEDYKEIEEDNNSDFDNVYQYDRKCLESCYDIDQDLCERECTDDYSYSEYDFSDDKMCYEYRSDEYGNDDEYKLQNHISEDFIIRKGIFYRFILFCFVLGTVEIRPLMPHDNSIFESDNDEAQIFELVEQSQVKSISQLICYDKYALYELKRNELPVNPQITQSIENLTKTRRIDEEIISRPSEERPLLVPIVKDGFQQYSSAMESSSESDNITRSSKCCYEKCTNTDDDSMISEDINSKYLKTNNINKNESRVIKIMAEVISAENSFCEHKTLVMPVSDWVQIEELPSQKIAKHIDYLIIEVITADIIINGNAEESTNENSIDNRKKLEAHLTNTSILPKAVLQSIFCNSADANCVLVLLKDSFYIYGTLKVTHIFGSIETYGYVPNINEEMEIFSPRGFSAVRITPVQTFQDATKDQLNEKLKRLQKYFSCAELMKIVENYTVGSDAVILLKRNVKRKQVINMFKKYMNENVFPNMNTIHTDHPLHASESLLRCMINMYSKKAIILPRQWKNLCLQVNSRLMITGGKAVGKSTFLRVLLNTHLQQFRSILIIDLDIGQPELFVPQTISCTVVSQPLLGPSCFLNSQPDKAYFIGHSNLILCAHTYMRAVKKLLNYCKGNTEYLQLPWIVNTMGYNKGFGLELISVISELLHPTDIVQLQSNREMNNFDAVLQPQTLVAVSRNIFVGDEFKMFQYSRPPQYSLHVFASAVPQESRYHKEWDMSAKDMRYAMILSRLSCALHSNAEWLTDCKPFRALLGDIKLVNLLSDDLPREELLSAIEGNLVYLCHWENNEIELECLGIGIVRGIDYNLAQIYLHPAMPAKFMSIVNCLAIGEMPLPNSIFSNQGPKVQNVAPFLYNSIDAKASKSIKQIYHRPFEFLTSKRKTTL